MASSLELTAALVVTTTPQGDRAVVIAAGPISSGLDGLDLFSDGSPILLAEEMAGPVLEADLERSTRWPEFASATRPLGVRAVFAWPLFVGAINLGVLAAFRDRPGELTPPEITALAGCAAEVTDLLLEAQAAENHGYGDVQPLMSVGANRFAKIHQAVGMVSAQLDCSMNQALHEILRHAATCGRPINAVAGDVTTRRLRFRSG
jgi:hypothetical protein